MPITRRDFLNGMLIGAGSLLLDLPAPFHLFAETQSWDGYGGVGDYAVSHGNTDEVVRNAHRIRDGLYERIQGDIVDTRETFDLIMIGGGLSGLGAAFHFKKKMKKGRTCLILENHPLPGGEAKRNEFMVNGLKLIGPQGSNSFSVTDNTESPGYNLYPELGIPRKFRYQKFQVPDRETRFDRTNYGFMLWLDDSVDVGYFIEDNKDQPKASWLRNIWAHNLENVPFPDKVKKDMITWRTSRKRYHEDGDFKRWLDTMTYKDYLEKVMGLSPEVTRYIDPVLAAGIGLGSDAISAFGAYQIVMPGFQGFSSGILRHMDTSAWHSFPGGNDGFTRYFTKRLFPDAIPGETFEDIMNQRINFGTFDHPDNRIRLRVGSLAVSVKHDSEPEKSEYVQVVYLKEGKLYQVKARGLVMANGSWVTKKIVRDLPQAYREAYGQFFHSPVLVVNVAVTNWAFLYKLGFTACRWFEGFGFSCNIRQPMIVGDYQPPLDPDKPAIITFYVPFYYPGLPVREQGIKGRMKLLSTSYSDFESQIRDQMIRLFGKSGFKPDKDLAGIILNRWGHAYVNPQPGFYFGRDGKPAPRDVIRRRFGRISFAHAELNGHQHWAGAAAEGIRAVDQIFEVI